MEPDQIIDKLKKAGADISRKTLYNWEKWGLVPEASFRNSRTTVYPENAWAEAFATDKLRNNEFRLKKEKVKAIREKALEIEQNPSILLKHRPPASSDYLTTSFAVDWLLDKTRAEYGIADSDIELIFENINGEWSRDAKPAEKGTLIVKSRTGDRENLLTLGRLL